MAFNLLFNDTFTRANNAAVGNGWAESNASLTSILANKLRFIGGGSFSTNVCVAPAAADFADGQVYVDFVHNTSSVSQIYARWDNATRNGYIIYWNGGLLRMERLTGGNQTSLNTASATLSVGTNYRYTFTLTGSTKTGVLRNMDTGTDIATVSNSSDSTYTTGSVGVSNHTTGSIDYDNFNSFEEVATSITTDVLKNDVGSTLMNRTGFIANIYSKTTGALIVRKTAQTTDANGIMVITDALLSSATVYRVEVDDGALAFGSKEYTAA